MEIEYIKLSEIEGITQIELKGTFNGEEFHKIVRARFDDPLKKVAEYSRLIDEALREVENEY